MTHREIVNKVKSILNEHGVTDEMIIGEDRVLLENYINAAIPDAVAMLAAKGYVVNKKSVSVSDAREKRAAGEYLSFIAARSDNWKKDVTQLTPTDSPEYAMAQNKFTKPGNNSPIVWWDDRHGDLCWAPSSDDEKITLVFNAKYFPYKTENGELDENYRLGAEEKEATSVCYMAAALVSGMFGDDQGKQRLSDIATNMLQ